MAKLEIRFSDGLVELKELQRDRSFVVGTDENADLRVLGDAFRPRHAVIRWVDRRYRLEVDPAAKNVFVGVSPVTQLRLKPDAEFSIGDIEFHVRYSADELGTILVPTEEVTTAQARAYRPPLYRSRSFFGIALGLVILSLLGVGLYFLVRARAADRLFDTSMKDVADGLFGKGIQGFDRFLSSFPDDPRADEATYLRAKARVLEVSSGSEVSWSQALDRAQQMMAEAGRTREFAKHPTEILDLLVGIARGLADDARQRADQGLLDKSSEALALAAKAYSDQTPSEDGVQRVRSLQEEATLAIERNTMLSTITKQMDESIAADKPMDAYKARIELLHRYPDLAADQRIADRLVQAVEKDQSLARFEPMKEAPSEPAVAAPPSWSVYRTTATSEGSQGPVLVLTIADVLYAIDRATGLLRWRVPVGDTPAFAPRLTEDGAGVIAHHAGRNAIVLFDAATGSELSHWSLGNVRPIYRCEPTLFESYLLISAAATPADGLGRVLVLRIARGQLSADGMFVLPQPVVTPVGVDSERKSILIAGEQATTYVASLERRSIERAFPTGHEPGAIKLRPVVVGRFLFIVERVNLDSSRLRAFVIAGDGSLKESTSVSLAGVVSDPPLVRSGRLFIASDRGDCLVFDLGAETDPQPFTKVAEYKIPNAEAGVPAFVRAEGPADFWVLTTSARHFRVLVDRKTVEPAGEYRLDGPAWHESTLTDGRLIAASSNETVGGAALAALRAPATEPEWKTSLGAIPLAFGPVRVESAQQLLVSFPGGRHLLTPSQALDSEPLRLPLTPTRPGMPTDDALVRVEGWENGIVEVAGSKLRYTPPNTAPEEYAKEIPLPGEASGLANRCGEGVLIPSKQGYVFWIRPEDGQELSDPFAAPIIKGTPLVMTAALPLQADDPAAGVIAAGGASLIKLELALEPTRVWQATTRRELEGSGEIRRLALGDGILWAFRDQEVVAVDPADFAILGSLPLEGLPKFVVARGKQALAWSASGKGDCLAVANDRSVAKVWSTDRPRELVGAPALVGDSLWTLGSNGETIEWGWQDGAERRSIPSGRRIVSGPIAIDEGLFAVGADGSVFKLPVP